jgi:two-component system, LytTR family, response regulator
MDETLKTVVIEDEPVSRDLLTSLLEVEEDIEIVGVAGQVSDAVDVIEETQPDFVFMDIELPDGTGFDVIRAISPANMPSTVFVTAYDEYAVEAFNVAAVDYLLKPFDKRRFAECLDRVRARLRAGAPPGDSRLLALLEELRSQKGVDYADSLPVDAGTHVLLLPIDQVDWVEAKGKHVLVHARKETYRMKEGLTAVAARLNPRDFLRVHRSAVVRADRVRQVHRWIRGEYQLVLADGTKLVTGLTYRKGVESRLFGDRKPPVP